MTYTNEDLRQIIAEQGGKWDAGLMAIAWLREREEAVKWEDVETAPIGVEVLAKTFESQLHGAIKQADGDWWWNGQFFEEDEFDGWMPLP